MNADLFCHNTDRRLRLAKFPMDGSSCADMGVLFQNPVGCESIQKDRTEIKSMTSKQFILTTKWNTLTSSPYRRRSIRSIMAASESSLSSDPVSDLGRCTTDQENRLGFTRYNVVNQTAAELANYADEISGIVSKVLKCRESSLLMGSPGKEKQLRERIDSMETVVCEKDREVKFLEQQCSDLTRALRKTKAIETEYSSKELQTDDFFCVDGQSQTVVDYELGVELDEAKRMIILQLEESRLQEESFLREIAALRQVCEMRIASIAAQHKEALYVRNECVQDSCELMRVELGELRNTMEAMECDWRREMDLRKKLEFELGTIREQHKSEIAERDSEIIALRVGRVQTGEEINGLIENTRRLETTVSDLTCLVQTLRIRNDCLNRENSKLVLRKKNDDF